MKPLRDLLARLADRDAKRSEATVQADIRTLLLSAPFHLSEEDIREVYLESPAGDRRRIDVEMGTTVFEVKRDLRRSGVLGEALAQLTDYVRSREAKMERRYVGVLADGAEWRCYHLAQDRLEEASAFVVRKDKPDLDSLLVWLEGVLATAQHIPPVPEEIRARLGSGSSAHALDQATLQHLYDQHKEKPDVRIKRQLWARLLTTALGSQFEDRDDLFVEHTLLVNTAEIIAHAVLGLDVGLIPPASLLSGAKFSEHGIRGVVEPDFFDWVIDVPRGDIFVRTLARRLARFDWNSVEHDVLKVLYESVIAPETRKKLGEYYTPDWLAEGLVEKTVRNPLSERVLDPACGSGTFLFHAVRRYLVAAEMARKGIAESLRGVSEHVLGMDLHPVAVTLARVTYLLAIGPQRLAEPERGDIQIPVYLGDSMQWQQKSLELFTAGYLVIQVDGDLNLFTQELRFPETLLNDARNFDELVEALAKKAAARQPSSPVPSLRTTFQRLAVPEAVQASVEATFRTMCRLHDEGRDHIWGYYVRNLARPVWLTQRDHRVDILLGNPPWLAFRHMTREMQEKFKEMSESRGLWHGAKVATHQDLSGLFLARVVQLYLRTGGRFAFVMPNSALDRMHFKGFRKGEYTSPEGIVRVSFDTPWDLRKIRPHFFPRGSAVVFGDRVEEHARIMPRTAEVFSGRLEERSASWSEAEATLKRRTENIKLAEEQIASPYRKRFRQGASVVPRVLFMVEIMPPGPLGLRAGTVVVRSVRSANEKPPWKNLDALEGVIESEFVFPLYLGEHVLPYRSLKAARAILPWQDSGLMSKDHPRLELYPGLSKWWHQAEDTWDAYRSSDKLSLVEQLDYRNKLTSQFPPQPIRILYTKSGMHLAAVCVEDRRAVIDHTLYWATASSRQEALFLCAIINSAEVTRRVRPFMSYGKDERHIDKYLWNLPIPEFDSNISVHAQLVALAETVEKEIQSIDLSGNSNYVSKRRTVRRFLEQNPEAQKIERIVKKLLDESMPSSVLSGPSP